MQTQPKRNQVLVPVPMSPKFVAALQEKLIKLGKSNRADFIRDAILEKLKNEGEPIDPAIAAAPSRAGKGGRPTHAPKPPNCAAKASEEMKERLWDMLKDQLARQRRSRRPV